MHLRRLWDMQPMRRMKSPVHWQRGPPKVLRKQVRVLRRALADAIAHNARAGRVQRNERVLIAKLRRVSVFQVSAFLADIPPRFIQLHAGTVQVAHERVVKLETGNG